VKPTLTLQWDYIAAFTAMRCDPEKSIEELRRDGSKASMLVLDYLGYNGFEKIPDGKSGWLLNRDGNYHRLRVVTDRVQFDPSFCRGIGRTFSLSATKNSMKLFDAFLVFDAAELPLASVYTIPVQTVSRWIQSGTVNRRDGSMSRLKWIQVIS